MIWVDDKTGRFKKRPHYSQEELDVECEKIVQTFLNKKYGKYKLPISTDDLAILIEQETEDFDSFCDLSEEGEDVEGITYFTKNGKPTVKISTQLQQPFLENRLRTTLTHEFFHVKFHDFLYQIENPPSLFDQTGSDVSVEPAHKCKRNDIINAPQNDWMEWQAGYGCGAFLIPASELQKVVTSVRGSLNLAFETIYANSSSGKTLISEVVSRFQTSKEAAKVRLLQKQYLLNESAQRNMKLMS